MPIDQDQILEECTDVNSTGQQLDPQHRIKDLEMEMKFKEDNINDLIQQLMQKDNKISQLED